MPEPLLSDTFRTAIGLLRQAGVVPAVARAFGADSETAAQSIVEAILSDVPAYAATGNPDVLPELRQHVTRLIDALLALLADRNLPDVEFVLEHARRRAEQKFPLEALVQTLRAAHKALLPRVRDASLAVASRDAQVPRVVAAVTDVMSEYVDSIGKLAIGEYVAHTRRFAEAEGDRRSELLNILLLGYDESDRRAADVLRRSGYLEQRQSFCVVLARSVNPGEMQNAARAQRMLDAVDEALNEAPVRALLAVRDGLVTAVVSAVRRQSGWTAPQSLLAERLLAPLEKLGPAALVGVSMDAPSTSHIPRALEEASLALDAADVANRVVSFGDIPVRQMLVQLAAEQVQATLPNWLGPFARADEKARGIYVSTLRAYADHDMNVLRTAEALSIHPNTVYARIQKIEGFTGHNPLKFHSLNELLLATDCLRS